jgi:uncharacterized protein
MTNPGSTSKTTIKRLREKASNQVSDLYSILDENLVAHVGLIHDGSPLVIPMAYGRVGNRIYLHGSTGSRLMRTLANEPEVCISITELNALKVARSTFDSGMHYRSVVIFGKANLVQAGEKAEALDAISDSLIPGRVQELRPSSEKELAATLICWVELDQTSVKISANEVDSDPDELGHGVWAGIVPLQEVALDAIPADQEAEGLPIPESVKRFIAARQKVQ